MQQMTLRARTIETLGYMIEAVAEEKATFLSSIHEISNFIIVLLKSGLSSEDPQITAIKETLCKIAFTLKEDFNVYMGAILPGLLEDTKQQIDIKLTSADDPSVQDDEDKTTGVTLKLKGFEGQQKISMNTSDLESKITAFKLLHQISDNMGKSFAPYCEAVLPIMLENMSY